MGDRCQAALGGQFSEAERIALRRAIRTDCRCGTVLEARPQQQKVRVRLALIAIPAIAPFKVLGQTIQVGK
jgi:hypothetical protein